MSESTKRYVLTRREALLLSATAGISIVGGNSALASDSIKTAAHQEPGNCSTPRSAVAKTQYGKVRGFVGRWCLHVQGCSLWPDDSRGEPLASGQAAGALDGRVSGAGLRSELPAEPAHLDEPGADVSLRLGRWLAKRGHAQAEHLDAQPDGQATRDVLHPRRRIQLRILLRTALARRRADGAASRRRAGLRQPSPQYPWVLRRLGDRRVCLRGFRKRWHDRSGGGAALGPREHRELRRRSGSGDDLRPVGRRIEGDDADGHALCCRDSSIVRRRNQAAAATFPRGSSKRKSPGW